ncbi:MAG: sugar-binding protein, partial [Verrucomicrobiota bacterium]
MIASHLFRRSHRLNPTAFSSLSLAALLSALLLLLPGCGNQPGAEATAANDPEAETTAQAAPAKEEATEEEPLYGDDFEATDLSGTWTTEGDVSVAGPAFAGEGALTLTRTQDNINEPIWAESGTFPLEQGSYVVSAATKTDLFSPDNSYLGAVVLETVDKNGKAAQSYQIVQRDGKRNWKRVNKTVGIPANITEGRFKVEIRKAKGEFQVDGLSIRRSVDKTSDPVVDRLFFDTVQMGNLLFPEDSREVKVTVWTKRELEDRERELSFVVTDYWGAEQGKELSATLQPVGQNKRDLLVYEGSVDLSPVELAVGRYYELNGTLTKKDGEPFSNHTSFAILPEAIANQFPPQDIPFTSRTWDARNAEALYLSHRLGIRIATIWGSWSPEPPYEASAPVIEVIEELGMGFLSNTPVKHIEKRRGNWDKYDETALREGMKNFIEKYDHIRPMIITAGNEPNNHGDAIDVEMKAYEIIYKTVKEVDPTITVLGTSVGPNEAYFAKGLGKWCDAYNFHVYGDSSQIRHILEVSYPKLFEKYGYPRPIWSTEVGLNSQGMQRQAVAVELVRKFSNFFAGGGASVCWFGIMYPDIDNRIADSFGSAHNVFDCRYNKYAPKLDAMAYYNMVNGIAVKKFVTDTVTEEGIEAYLFRDSQGRSLLVLYTEDKQLEKDLFLPLPGVGEVLAIQIDGTRTTLDAGGKGIAMTVNDDPVLLLYEGGSDQLPDLSLPAAVQITSLSNEIVAGQSGEVQVSLDGVKPDEVKLAAQPGWQVTPSSDGTRYTLLSPEGTRAREAALTLAVMDASGNQMGELRRRPAVTGAVNLDLRPVPAKNGGEPAVAVHIRNNSPQAQEVDWQVELLGQHVAEGGTYGKLVETGAFFKEEPNGTVTVEGGSTKILPLPLSGFDPLTVYQLKGVARDAMGRRIVKERVMGGFVAVPRAEGLTMNGRLDEAAWQKAPVQKIDRETLYYMLKKPVGVPPSWEGPEDLSGELRFLWDEDYLYLAVEVTDDTFGARHDNSKIWFQDGLQFLVDPSRASDQGVGKYDYAVALGTSSPKAWSYLSADSGTAPPGEVTDMVLGMTEPPTDSGNMVYEVAIPWSRVSPFQPEPGANLGFT